MKIVAKARRCALMVLTMLPVASVSFAAQSALKVNQIGSRRASDRHLIRNSQDSHTH